MKLFSNLHVLSLPGLNGSGADHWQSIWEKNNPAFLRVEASNWSHPQKDLWVQNLETAVASRGPSVVLLAHSLGCLQAAHWAAGTALKIKGAFLVAPPNAERLGFPQAAVSFRGVPRRRFSFPSMVVASSDDPYCAQDYAQAMSHDWGSAFVNIGPKGHINALGHLGEWPEGFELFRNFVHPLT